MFRVIKLALYGLLAYGLYEFFQGMCAGSSGGASQGSRGTSSHALDRALDEDESRTNVDGSTAGRRQRTEDFSGHSESYEVGRGVISR